MGITFRGTGAALPQKCISNEELSKTVETSDEWIRTRTGITQRYFAAKDQYTSDLATQAGQQALENAGLAPGDIDLLILATTTPDETFPATAVKVQHRLGIGGMAFDVQAVCSGYLLALKLAAQALSSGEHKRVLIIGAETMSRILDMSDRRTCVLFGDGAGAVIIEQNEQSTGAILGSVIYSDGKYHDILYTPSGVCKKEAENGIVMEGQDVFRHAVTKLATSAEAALEKSKLTTKDVSWFIPHQANQRIIDAMCRKMGIPVERVISTVSKHANTSAASIPLALHEAVSQGKIKSGDIILHQAIGAGLVWGSTVIRWK